MGTIPQCNRFVTALTKETSYGTAIADGSLVNMFHLTDPALASVALDRQRGNDLLRGHEFEDSDGDAWDLMFRDINLPLNNVPLNAEFVGWAAARALGACTSTQIGGTGDYDHVCKLIDKCAAGDQLPSSTIGVLFSGSSTVNRKYKGGVVNTFSIRIDSKGRVTGNVEIITDGNEADGSGISVPASFHSENFYFGTGVTLEFEDFGVALVDETSKLRSFELTVNNNLDVDGAKNLSFATQTVLSELRLGDRDISARLVLTGDESGADYADALAGTKKVVRVTVDGATLTGGNDADMVIDIPEARWVLPGEKGYDGTKRVINIDHDIYMNSTQASPLVIQVTTRDTAYL